MTTRQRILEAARRRFADEGLAAVTLDEIRREAGVSVGSLYHHFASKQEVYDATWQTELGAYRDHLLGVLAEHPQAEPGVKAAVRAHVDWLRGHPDAAAILLGARPSPAAQLASADRDREFFRAVLAWWRTHVSYGAVRELGPAALYAIWFGPAQEYARVCLDGRSRYSRRDVDALVDAAWRALRSSADGA